MIIRRRHKSLLVNHQLWAKVLIALDSRHVRVRVVCSFVSVGLSSVVTSKLVHVKDWGQINRITNALKFSLVNIVFSDIVYSVNIYFLHHDALHFQLHAALCGCRR